MEITCSNCHHTWRVSAGSFLAAKLKFAFGAHEHAFICPNCHEKNAVSKHRFDVSDPQLPETGNRERTDTYTGHPPRAYNDPASAPTNPITAPDPSARRYRAVVLESNLHLRRDHTPSAEIMGTARKGQEITILDTWSDGEYTWVQIGPERWTTVEQDGETLLALTEE